MELELTVRLEWLVVVLANIFHHGLAVSFIQLGGIESSSLP
jgi:hypothetical protein